MLIVDEADAIMPQKPNPGEERMLGAGEDIVRRGGQRGIGCMMISQRTAVLNKNVLTQCEMLVALRTISPQDLKAMQAWIDVHGEEGERDTLMQSLPSLPQGDAWFWSPGWPTSDGIFQRVHVLPIETFDSGATPKSGEKRIEPKRLADIDLPALTRQMAATIERARADDPKELRKEILSLRAQLAKAPVAKVAAGRTTAGADRAQIRRLTTALDAAMKFIVKITAADFDVAGVNKEDLEKAVTAAVDRASALIDQRLALRAKQIDVLRLEAERIGIRCKGLLEGLDADVTVAVDVARQPPFSLQPHRGPNGAAPARRETPRRSTVAAEGVTGVEQRILNTLLALEEMGVSPVDKPTAAALVGYHPNAKSYANALGSLNSGGRVRYPSGGQVELTDEGRAIARSELAIASVADLHATWFDRLGNVARKILEPLIESYPNARTADDVAQHAGYHPNAKSFANTKGRLRTLGLIDYPRSGEIVATRVLFPEGLT
jgi:hypothetical protein